MKFRDVKTLEHLLKEYGATPGASAYSGFATNAKALATNAKATAKSTVSTAKSSISKGKSAAAALQGRSVAGNQSSSPNVTGPGKKPEVKAVPVMAKDLEDGSIFKDNNGKEAGTVVSKLGSSPQPKKVVVQTAKGDYELYDPNTEVMIDEDLGHDILKKVTKQKTNKKNSIARRIKRLARQRLGEQELFEINFNKRSEVEHALDLPIRCGFEAETSWESIYGGSGTDVDDMAWYEVENELYISNRDQEYIDEGFSEWVRESQVDNYYDDVKQRYVEDQRDDDVTYERFMEESGDAPSQDAVDDYKEAMRENDPIEFQNREEDGWEPINWMREFIDEEYESEFIDWLEQDIDEEGEAFQEAYDEAYNDTSIDEWINDAYYNMSSFLDDYGIDYSEMSGGSLEEVAEVIHNWAVNKNSISTDYPETGDYGHTSTDGWAVETDSSIESGGTGAEIISPVYSSPRQMLEEMRTLFHHIDEHGAETNSSTGLHVTMSWQGETKEINKLKMASLLGDSYLLSTFGRERNSYTKQQSKNLKKAAVNLQKNISKGKEGMHEIEKVLTKSISNDKFTSINFKSEKDRDSGTNLIEFRIGGGDDYHHDMAKVVKAVIRYATIMEAGYTDKFTKDYANAIYRIVNNAGQLSAKEIDDAKELFQLDDVNEPLVDVFKTLLSKDNYFDGIGSIVNAFKQKQEYETLILPGADKEWKQSIKDYEAGTGRRFDGLKEVEEGEPITGYIEPKKQSPSERAPKVLVSAQNYFLKSLGILAVDVALEKHRSSVNAKTVGVMRKSLNEFYLDENEMGAKILQSINDVNIPTQNGRADQKIVVIKRGIDTLFKKDILKAPDFLKLPQAEKLVNSVWNAITHPDYSREDNDIITELLLKMNFGDNIDKDNENNAIHNTKVSIQNLVDNREFNSFYSNMVSSSYNSSTPPAEPGEVFFPKYYKELLQYCSKFPDYNEPVSPEYNKNIYNDDTYIENYLNTYTMKLRKRFVYLGEVKNSEPAKYYDAIEELGKITQELVKSNATLGDGYWDEIDPEYAGTDLSQERDGNKFLAFSDYSFEKLNDYLDRIAKKEYSDPFDGDIGQQLGDRLSESIREMLGGYYRKKENNPKIFLLGRMPEIIKDRFAGIKKWMSGFDKLAQSFGFDSQAAEIADKNAIEQREKNFHKQVQNSPPLKLNIPEGSKVFIKKEIFDLITNKDFTPQGRKYQQVKHKKSFTSKINEAGVYVIPSQHWNQAYTAMNTKETLEDLGDTPLGKSQQWRMDGVNLIRTQFRLRYKISYERLIRDGEHYEGSEDMYETMKKSGIEVSREGSSIDGEPLVPAEKLQNPTPGNNTGFDANDNAIEQVIKDAAQVQNYDGESSNTIHAKANYSILGPKLGIESGVNAQGIVLLRKVVDQFQGDARKYKMDDGTPIVGMKRWVLSVKDSIDYINNNYTVSAGNYFRKDADGNPGDDVSGVYGRSELSAFSSEVSEQDYADMRSKYFNFNAMMMNGIQNYILQPDVNRLVGFLKNPDNDEAFKEAVLHSMMREQQLGAEPNDFQGALAKARSELQGQRESVFARFDKLSLQEQITKLQNIDINKINQLHEKALGRAELKYPERIQTFADKLKAGEEFTLAGGQGSIKLDPDMAMDFENASVASELPDVLKTADGEIIRYSALEKTAEFGSRGGGEEKVSNKGEVAEGILGCGTFARLLVRPSAPVTSADIENVIKQLPTDAPDQGGWHELTLTAQEVDNPIADFFTLTVNLKSDTYQDFIDPQKWGVMQNISAGVVDYVNDNLEKYTNYFQANGKVDTVKVIADGVSGETDTKVDVFLTHSLDGGPEKTLQHFDMSVKVGSTKQMGQVGGGKQTESLSVRYSILLEMWQRFDVDISTIEQDFLNAETVEQGYKIAYTEAVRQLNSHLTSEEKEQEFLMTLLNAIKFFATLNDDRVKLVQFTDLKAGGYYVLDFKKLDRMFDKDRVDLEAKMIETAKHPKITIFNKVTNKDFLSIRMYQAGSGYIRNYIEKEKGLVDLTKVRGSGMRKKVESVNEGAVPNNDTVRKLKEILAKPLLTNDLKSQMYAYVAIPDPSMIRDFRAARASYGDNHDLRSIVKSYAKLKLHDDIKKQFSK